MLELRSLCSGYGRLQVLFDVSLQLDAGEAVALLGPNGAGKTTLVNTIAGLVHATDGGVYLDGEDVTKWKTHERARFGLGLVPTGRALFGPLSVERNLRLGQLSDKSGESDRLDLVFELFPVLAERRSQKANTMSGGQQQMLAIARALVGRPRVLILDEPSLGLAPVVTEQLYEALGRLNEMGQTLMVVEEKVDFALQLAERYVVLNGGQIVLEGVSAELDDATELSVGYLG
jgi:branched-chain amino acid transport system ATP-binding protein